MTSVPGVFAAGDVVDTTDKPSPRPVWDVRPRLMQSGGLRRSMTEHAERPSRGVDAVRHARHLRMEEPGLTDKQG